MKDTGGPGPDTKGARKVGGEDQPRRGRWWLSTWRVGRKLYAYTGPYRWSDDTSDRSGLVAPDVSRYIEHVELGMRASREWDQ